MLIKKDNIALVFSMIGLLLVAGTTVYVREQARKLPVTPIVVKKNIQSERESIKRLELAPTMPSIIDTWNKVKNLAEFFSLSISVIDEREVISSAYQGPATAWGARVTGNVIDLMDFAIAAQESGLLTFFGNVRSGADHNGQLIFAVIGVEDEHL